MTVRTQIVLPDHFEYVLQMQMLIDGLTTATIRFFRAVYPYFREDSGGLSQTQMCAYSDMTPQAAKKHLLKLTKLGYLLRKDYRTWVLPKRFPINDPFLLTLANSL